MLEKFLVYWLEHSICLLSEGKDLRKPRVRKMNIYITMCHNYYSFVYVLHKSNIHVYSDACVLLLMLFIESLVTIC